MCVLGMRTVCSAARTPSVAGTGRKVYAPSTTIISCLIQPNARKEFVTLPFSKGIMHCFSFSQSIFYVFT